MDANLEPTRFLFNDKSKTLTTQRQTNAKSWSVAGRADARPRQRLHAMADRVCHDHDFARRMGMAQILSTPSTIASYY